MPSPEAPECDGGGAAVAAGCGGVDVRMGGDEDEAPCGILRGKAHWDPAETSGQGKPSDGTCPNQYAVAICSAVEREGEGVLTGVRPEKKRGAEEMNRDPGSSGSAPASTSLDATELLVAEILGGWQTCPGQANAGKRVRSSSSSPLSHASTDVPEERQGSSRSSLPSLLSSPSSASTWSKKPSSRAPLPSPSRGTKKRAPPSGSAAAAAAGGAERHEVPDWAVRIVSHLKTKGQHLLHAICSHYRIDLESIAEYSVEQIAHNAIFNPALPKAGRLPIMLKDVDGVDSWDMTFVRGPKGIYRSVRVSAMIGKVPLSAECRACSYCGSVFSGRFMKNAIHQRAGGWKEITEKTAAGKYSWKSQLGKRLCVPCFTHFASQGTNLNANRLSLDQLIDAHSAEQPSWVRRRLGGESDGEASESSKGSGMSATTGSSLSESSGSDDGGDAAGLCSGEGEEDSLARLGSSSAATQSPSSSPSLSSRTASSSSFASKPHSSSIAGGSGDGVTGGRGGRRGVSRVQAKAKSGKRGGPGRVGPPHSADAAAAAAAAAAEAPIADV